MRGCDGQLVAYASTQAHSSIEKAVKIAGLGERQPAADRGGRELRHAARPLAAAIAADRAAGLLPCFVCATVGTTSSNAIDPVRAIGEICREQGVWLHVDAAMAGTAALCPEFRCIQDGAGAGRQLRLQPAQVDVHQLRLRLLLRGRPGQPDQDAEHPAGVPAATRPRESGAVIDYRDWHVPLGRRFRSLKLWFVIRHYGVEGLRHHVRRHVELAQEFARWVQADPRFELAAPAPLNLVCFRLKAGDEANRQLMHRLNQSGDLYLTHTVLDGRVALRLCIGQTHTEARHVEQAWRRIREMVESGG